MMQVLNCFASNVIDLTYRGPFLAVHFVLCCCDVRFPAVRQTILEPTLCIMECGSSCEGRARGPSVFFGRDARRGVGWKH